MTSKPRNLPAAWAFGMLMIGAATYRGDGVALVAAACGLFAVFASAWVRPAATAAVLLAVATIGLADPAPLYTALAGLAAAAYLLVLHSNPTVPTTAFAVGFAGAAAVALVLPVQVPWLPLIAPLALLVAYLVAVRPFVGPDRPSASI